MRAVGYRMLLLVVALSFWAAPAAASGRITDIVATPQAEAILVAAELTGGFPQQVVDQIRRGVPKELFYTVTLKRRHRRFFDEEVLSSSVVYAIKYDTLEGRYQVSRTDADGNVMEHKVPTYAEALSEVSRIDNVLLAIPERARKDGRWYVSVKAEMRAVRLPMYLDYVFFFIPILEFETPWARSPNLILPR